MHGVSNQVNLFNDIFDGRNKLLCTILRFNDVDIVATRLDDIDDGSQYLIVEGEDAQPDNIMLVVRIRRQFCQLAQGNAQVGVAQPFSAGRIIEAF